MLLVLFNSGRVTKNDMAAIEEYGKSFNSRLIDVRQYETAPEIYQMLKEKYSHPYDSIKGVQIFGINEDVPAFECKFKCKMSDDEIDSWWGRFKTDFCYSNFAADSDYLKSPIKIYDIMESKAVFQFAPDWQVARVPLTRGQISKFVKRSDEFKKQNPKTMLPICAFSCTVLDEDGDPNNLDDICYFMKERLDKEFNLLEGVPYSLYGNTFGEFPIKSAKNGKFSTHNLILENKKGPRDFWISTHGFKDQFVHSIKWPEEEKAHLYSFLGINNVNKKLKYNGYTLTAWCCHLARDLDDQNFIHKALRGRCVDAVAATNILSNNQSINTATLKEMESNNPFFLRYQFVKNLSEGCSRCESLSRAKAEYAKVVLEHQDQYNYQYNLHNILVLHYFGLIT